MDRQRIGKLQVHIATILRPMLLSVRKLCNDMLLPTAVTCDLYLADIPIPVAPGIAGQNDPITFPKQPVSCLCLALSGIGRINDLL